MKRIPTLDGWRGVAILLVIIQHFQAALLHGLWIPTGQHGVTLFFALSGLLITSKLVESGVNLGSFYSRRLFRLMPVAWAFLVAAGALGMLTPREALGCLCFCRNYMGDVGQNVALHYWSLSIEEQFYFVWPAALLLFGPIRAKWISAMGAAGCFAWMATHNYRLPFVNLRTEFEAGSLFVGCFFALALHDDKTRSVTISALRWIVVPSALFMAWAVIQPVWAASPLECCACGVLVAYTAVHGCSLLDWNPLAWIGRCSYSLYVWHYLILVLISRNWMFVALLPVPFLSYYLIEKPGIAIGAAVTSMNVVSCVPRVQHD